MLTLNYAQYCSAESILCFNTDKISDFGKSGHLALAEVETGGCMLKTGGLGPVPLKQGSIAVWGGYSQLISAGPCSLRTALITGPAAKEVAEQVDQPVIIESVLHPAAGPIISLLHKGQYMEPSQLSELAFSILCRLTSPEASDASRPALVTAAIAEIHSHFSEVYGVDELADSLNVSKSHLIRIFSKSMGISPGRYLTEARIQAAKKLLQSPDYSLDNIAGLCGFSGANYFCRVFKKETGETPAVWRSNNQDLSAVQYFDDDWEASFFL